jgi:V8-like Glu-specific endopeptidase
MAGDINTKAIARIYKNNPEGNKSVKGTGFLISERYVLTCAHVVNAALGNDPNSTDKPDLTVQLDFPFTNPVLKRLGTVEYWRPVDKSRPEADIALLKLNEPLPNYSILTKLNSSAQSSSWQVFGFATDAGYWSKGTFRPPNIFGWVQMNPNDGEDRILEGFSGSPVWHENNADVIGMVVAIVPKMGHRATFMIPSEFLRPALNYADAATLLDYLDASSDKLLPTMRTVYHKCLPDLWEQPEPENLADILNNSVDRNQV